MVSYLSGQFPRQSFLTQYHIVQMCISENEAYPESAFSWGNRINKQRVWGMFLFLDKQTQMVFLAKLPEAYKAHNATMLGRVKMGYSKTKHEKSRKIHQNSLECVFFPWPTTILPNLGRRSWLNHAWACKRLGFR